MTTTVDNRRLTYLGLTGYVFIGTAAVLIPTVMPSIIDEFTAVGLTVAAIGLIFPVRAAGGILGNLVAGISADLLGRGRLVWLAAILLGLSLALVALAQPWLLFLAGFVMVSAAQGALATGINAMVADANRQSRARMLNILHGVYGVGAAISPLVIGYLIDQGIPWRWALGGTGIIWLVYGLGSYGLGRRQGSTVQVNQAQNLDLRMLGQRPFLALFLIAFTYNGVAFSLLGWVAIFLQESAGFSDLLSISMISVFYVALTTGRFTCAAFAEGIGYARTLLILAVGVALTYPLVVLDFNPILAVSGVFLTGLSLSGLFPTAMAYGTRLYPEQTGTVSGTLNVALTLGSMVPPLWTGVIADQWSFQTALGINYLMIPPLILIALYLGRVESQRHIEVVPS